VKGVLFANIDLDAARDSRKALDVTGHYNRPDIFHLEIDRRTRIATNGCRAFTLQP